MKGAFITFEGGDGSGKTSHARLLAQHLESRKIPTLLTQEPGGTPMGQAVMKLLLDKNCLISPMAELLLFAADRAQHVDEVIRPALAAGKCVISSRFADATWVYQGVARGMDQRAIEQLRMLATGGLAPDLTFLLDLDPAEGLKRTERTHKSNASRGELDRIEAEGVEFQQRVRRGYLDLAKANPQRFRVLSSLEPREAVQKKIREETDAFLMRRGI